MSLIQPKVKVKNHQIRKRVEGESLIVKQYVEHILVKFEFYIFNAPAHISYKALYERFLEMWRSAIKGMMGKRQFKYIEIDVNYFINQYHPQV